MECGFIEIIAPNGDRMKTEFGDRLGEYYGIRHRIYTTEEEAASSVKQWMELSRNRILTPEEAYKNYMIKLRMRGPPRDEKGHFIKYLPDKTKKEIKYQPSEIEVVGVEYHGYKNY
jgi:hypothetical protein